MSNLLKFSIIFNKCTSDANFVIENAKLFFEEILEEVSDVRISELKNICSDHAYKGDFCEIEVSFQYSSPDNYESLISKVVQDWCNPKKNKLSNLWMSLINSSILENTAKLCHPDVPVKEIGFGTLPDMQHFMQHYNYESTPHANEMSSTFLHSQRKCIVYTCFSHLEKCKYEKTVHNKFQFCYNSVQRVIFYYVPDSDIVQIFFHLQHIPSLFINKSENKGIKPCIKDILASDQDYQEVRWDRDLAFGCQCKSSRCRVKRIGRCPIFKVVIQKKQQFRDIINRLIQRCPPGTTICFANIETVIPKCNINDFENFPLNESTLLSCETNTPQDIIFKCQFAWNTIHSRSLEIKDQILLRQHNDPSVNHWNALKKELECYIEINTDALVYALYDVSEMINKNVVFTFDKALKILFEYHRELRNRDAGSSQCFEDVPEGMCLVRRIIISPSRIIYLQPTEHFDNRVIRQYGVENFLRVSVQDDNFTKLTFAVTRNLKKNTFMSKVVETFLVNGIDIGQRKYHMLASSTSQLREHGLWMFAEDRNGNTVESIREWMGDFRPIKNVAKYMARMGQCFSTSDEAVQIELSDNEVNRQIDIKTEDGEFVFSDGIGMISQDLAQEVRKELAKKCDLVNFSKEDLYDPSAFQIRFKGCKGMVAESRTLNGRQIVIRNSMEKFQCNSSNALEIVKKSAPRALFLNRPLITILEYLGVKERTFMHLQKAMVLDITDSLIYEKEACKMLENNTSVDFPFENLSNSGIYITQEPFFRSLLLSVYKSSIEKLKRKTRIAIPPEYGRNMMGVLDETNTLKYGEIFVQYSTEVCSIKSPTKIREGTVVVTKNPCMHPGDVRKLTAVNVPALRHIKDCIVFPAKGNRPHPDEMAGSDLDGDEYVLIWYDELIFPHENCIPMDYPPNKEDVLNRNIQVEDMADFLCKYIEDDNIGTMANAYLVWADCNSDSIFSEECEAIAKKYPKALDFAKSGTTCTLHPNERPACYPDFMEKGCTNNNYKSVKSLGLLYRMIRNLEASVSNIDPELSVVRDSRLEIPGWEKYEEMSKIRRRQYSERVKNILRKYGIRNEAEALTGYVSKVSEYNSNDYDRENVVSLCRKYLIDNMNRYRLKFFRDCDLEGRNEKETKLIKMQMASAWYRVTYSDPEASILSFPWVVSDIVGEIRKEHGNVNAVASKSIFVNKFNDMLDSEFQMFKQNEEKSCKCVLIMKYILRKWMELSSFMFSTSAEDIVCEYCLERIVKTFRDSKRPCCSYSKSRCNCVLSCSPMTLILECFKYYAFEVPSQGSEGRNLGYCEAERHAGVHCEGFRDMNLNSFALKTYAALAITQDQKYLGLNDSGSSDIECESNEEGDPISIPVTKEFEEILTGNVERVCRILENLSGVKKVKLDGSMGRTGCYILVHSIGKAFQRFYLEELIMDPKSPQTIKNRLDKA